MIDVENLKYDGRQRNHQNGLTFYFTRQANVLSFLIDTVEDKRRKIKVKMYHEINHDRPHVHIDGHDATFAVDTGDLLAGECDNKTRKLIGNWIARHRDDLLQLWEIVIRGEVYQPVVERIQRSRNNWEYHFRGAEPRYKTVIDDVIVWHNDKILIERNNNGGVLVVGVGDLFVVFPANYPRDHIVFDLLEGALQVKIMDD